MIETWLINSTGTPFMESEEHATKFLGVLDTSFMITYATGLFVCGTLGDHYNPRKMLSFGMAMSSFTVFAFGYLTKTYNIHSKPLYIFLWVANGFSQSVGWPLEVAIMGNWFGHNARGTVMGVWSSCSSVGNIIGVLIASRFLTPGYQYPFLISSSMLLIYSLLVFLQLPSAPWEIFESETDHESEMKTKLVNLNRPPPLGFFRSWLLPGVISFSLAFACIKFVNDGFFFWLPFYLHSGLHWPEAFADSLSTWYDIGGIISSILTGLLSDRMKSRTSLVFYMLLVSIVSLYVYTLAPKSFSWNAFLLLLVGFFVGGPINMIASSIVADLGKSEKIKDNAEALSTVTGIIDGSGSVGSAIGQFMIPVIQHRFGWNSVFYGFMAMVGNKIFSGNVVSTSFYSHRLQFSHQIHA
uniref:MFS domain-containing protein n=1 Tax=Caenorhabditis japonica TaxID=281687 RepID=A0A8R1DL35_CAEJA